MFCGSKTGASPIHVRSTFPEFLMSMQVLICDDDEIALDILEHLLVEQGFDVLRATDGREALELLDIHSCRLVISDWEMPGLSGLELCQQIREGDFGSYIYVILLTSRDRSEDIVAGLGAGADDFITKPFQPDELTVRVRAGLRVLSLETRDLTIFALAKLAESRDPETGAHLERVQSYSRVLAQQLATLPKFEGIVTPEFIRLIYDTSPLHDIGKVAIPDAVLLKPGALSQTEFDIMKEHTLRGAETLDAALALRPEAHFLRMARDIAASHHERWDGTGYPLGLQGEEIPLCGRIVALADVYDALTSKRVYKPPFQHTVARSMIADAKGKHFDPDVVDAFLATEDRFTAIRERFQPAALAEV